MRDVLTEFEIDRGRTNAVIRSVSFDRAELTFEVRKTSPDEDALAVLRGIMNAMPGKCGLPATDFYGPRGRDTASGIVFVPTVRARIYGVNDAAQAVRTATSALVTVFSGRPPRGHEGRSWEAAKRENARAFKANDVPVLIATSAFGMGIDKA